MAGGALSGIFAANAFVPEATSFMMSAGQAYPLQGVDLLSGITSTLATMDPLLLGLAAAGLLYIGRSIMKSDHHPAPH